MASTFDSFHSSAAASDALPMDAPVTVTLSLEKIVALMRAGYLCGADLHASDPRTRALVHQACLQSCQQKVCDECEYRDHCPSASVDWPLPDKMPIA
ncbi:hypothetical protein [Thiomicrospira sp. WB1]|uniref:hypothetical protein n=1 Tax=Thiomicrospira sp. WB1 TaxID=1685380 RepID=UPI00074B1011|nr:hypothetical protein [Thiomicrospira sp. WB1]KUJ72693.1 hypothetical protein AVO41_02535 [Thiomicrospira sp. WB1]